MPVIQSRISSSYTCTLSGRGLTAMASALESLVRSGRLLPMLLCCAGLAAMSVSAVEAAQPYETMEKLRATIIERLEAHDSILEALADPDDPANVKVTIETADGEKIRAEVYLGNLFGRLGSLAGTDVETEMETFVETALSIGAPSSVDERYIYANIRHKDFVRNVAQAPDDDASEAPVFEAMAGDLVVLYQVDQGTHYRSLGADEMAGRTREELQALAGENIDRELAYLTTEPTGGSGFLFTIEDNTLITPAILLSERFWSMLDERFPEGALVAIPRRDQVFAYDRRSPDAQAEARAQIARTFTEGVDLLSEHLFERREGRLLTISE